MPAAANLTGRRFGKLVAKTRIGSYGVHALWLCQCDCGRETEVIATNLKSGNTRSCGCLSVETRHARAMDITGHKYGRATVVKMLKPVRGRQVALCRCDCGREFKSTSDCLRSGNTKSCGCLWQEVVSRHGCCTTPEYTAWEAIIQRCTNYRCPGFEHYGGRGISVCKEWQGLGGFENFFEHIGPRPSNKHSIDRYPNNDGNYEPGNVRWATTGQQARNRRNTRNFTHDGRTMCITDWAKELKCSVGAIYHHLECKRSFAEIVEHFMQRTPPPTGAR